MSTLQIEIMFAFIFLLQNSVFLDELYRNPLGLPIAKRDSLLEKCAMFREAGGALSRQPSQDNGLDGPFSSGASKLEQVPCLFTAPTLQHSKAVSASRYIISNV